MRPRKLLAGLAAFAVAASAGAASQAEAITHLNASGTGSTTINMDFVTVGDAGNVADTESMETETHPTSGYGAVPYTYQIGTYEVTAAQWAAVIAADFNVGNAGNWSGSQPIGGASWYEAAKFCNWLTTGHYDQGYYSVSGYIATPSSLSHDAYAALHGTTYFIPTEDEWYKAAYYKGGGTNAGYWDYPTQGDDSSPPDGMDYYGDTAFDALFNDGVDPIFPVAVTDAGVPSAYGTIGQGGNVWEWNETPYNTEWRGLRGASWGYQLRTLRSSGRYWNHPTREDFDFGFRVARISSVPEPSSIAMLVGLGLMGAIGCLWRKRRGR